MWTLQPSRSPLLAAAPPLGGLALACACAAVLALGAATAAGADDDPEVSTADDLAVVDCLLPQKVRRLGRRNTFLAPRQPIRTTAADCRLRGGEYTEPDQASYATALQVWLPRAESGDAEAQYFVGQIFERGLGATADYASAATWYQRAAEQGYRAAAVNLGYLYEEGLGVTRDEVKALNWYRRAAGLAEDLVVLEASEVEAARAELEAKEAEAEALRLQVDELRRQIDALSAESEEDQKRQAALQSLVQRLEDELTAKTEEAAGDRARIAELEASLERSRAMTASGGPAPATDAELAAALTDLPLGDAHALVIGNATYANLPPLEQAADDARKVAEVLEERYGFEVTLLVDASRFQILSALNDLRETLEPKDRLVVYYAGHGRRNAETRTAWWQPVDADPDRPVNWIPSALVAEHLDLIAANHVLLVANAVFGGLRTRSSVARLASGTSPEERLAQVRLLMERRARLVLSAVAPDGTPDAGFTDALVASLEANDGLLEASRLYEDVNQRLFDARGDASNLDFATLRWARNDLADFFFVPSR